MKTLLTTLLFAVNLACFGQPSKKTDDSNHLSFPFDALNGAKIAEANNAAIYAHKTDSVKWAIAREMLILNKVDFLLISNHPDSTKVTPQGIELILKPKNK